MEVERELLLEFLFMAMYIVNSYHLTDGENKRYRSSCISLRDRLGLSKLEAYHLYTEDKEKWSRWD